MKFHKLPAVWMILIALIAAARPSVACHDGSPLILDLNGDGIHTTDIFAPVHFDINGDGELETLAWTDGSTEEGFLWLDLNDNRIVDNGLELFGDATRLPSGDPASNGFVALAVYDSPELGGDADGSISRQDAVWPFLRLWIDRNHDGVSQKNEIDVLPQHGVASIRLQYQESAERDGNVNRHLYQGRFVRRMQGESFGPRLREQAVHDVFFEIKHEDHEH
jgi:hypothetical protein